MVFLSHAAVVAYGESVARVLVVHAAVAAHSKNAFSMAHGTVPAYSEGIVRAAHSTECSPWRRYQNGTWYSSWSQSRFYQNGTYYSSAHNEGVDKVAHTEVVTYSDDVARAACSTVVLTVKVLP